jgi:hypothetical protein
MADIAEFKKRMQSDKAARDRFSADIADVLRRYGLDIDAPKISASVEGRDPRTAMGWVVATG